MAKKKKKIVRKKKLTKKQLVKKLNKATVKEIGLPELKKIKDTKFRKEARSESLVPITDLNTEIRLKPKNLKGNKGDIQAQKNKIKFLQKENRKVAIKARDLKEEYPFASPERQKEINRLLKTPDYKQKDIFIDKNYLKALEGKDFDFIVNDGFKTYKLNTKELKKYWKKGQDVSLPILQKMEKDTKEAITHYEKLIKKEKKTASKQRLKKLNRIKDGLKKKLDHTIKKNIEAVKTGNMKVLDEYNTEGEKAYSLLFKVVGWSIDRIGI